MLNKHTTNNQSINQSILEPIDIFFDNGQMDATYNDYVNENDFVFGHEHIQEELDKYQLLLEGCNNCSSAIKHFQNPKSLIDTIAEKKIKWIQLPEAIMQNPAPHLLTPIFDPTNIHEQLSLS